LGGAVSVERKPFSFDVYQFREGGYVGIDAVVPIEIAAAFFELLNSVRSSIPIETITDVAAPLLG
jgi:hypothetical protein